MERLYLNPPDHALVLCLDEKSQIKALDRTQPGLPVLRLLTPLKMAYAVAKKRAEPYTKIIEELPQMRRETVQLVRQAVSEGRRAYVLVNNRSEGNAPLTVQGLTEMLSKE